jgi:hypothetical protein
MKNNNAKKHRQFIIPLTHQADPPQVVRFFLFYDAWNGIVTAYYLYAGNTSARGPRKLYRDLFNQARILIPLLRAFISLVLNRYTFSNYYYYVLISIVLFQSSLLSSFPSLSWLLPSWQWFLNWGETTASKRAIVSCSRRPISWTNTLNSQPVKQVWQAFVVVRSCALEKQHHALNIVTRYKYTTKYYNGFTKYWIKCEKLYIKMTWKPPSVQQNTVTIHCYKNQPFTEIVAPSRRSLIGWNL